MSVAPTAKRPHRFQFSLGLLLIAIAWVAVACVALKMPTVAWCSGMFLLAASCLLASVVGIIYQTGRSRAFAVGYCVFSFGYAASLFVVEKNISQFPAGNDLPTTQLADWLYTQWHQGSVKTVTAPASGMGGMGGVGGGGFGGGGGGFFSVDSSEAAVQSDAAATECVQFGGSGSDATDEAATSDDAATEVSGDAGMAMPGMGSSMGGMPGPGGTTAVAGMPGTVTYTVALYNSNHFRVIVHSIIAMLLGLLGGLIAQYFYASRRESPLLTQGQ